MEIRLEECGCTVQQDHDARVHIEYCPKHKASPDLYEACKYLLTLEWGIADKSKIDKAKQAIVKAES